MSQQPNSRSDRRPLRPSWCQLCFLACLGLISSVHSLPPRLRIDPPRGEVNYFRLDREGRPSTLYTAMPFVFNNKPMHNIWFYRDGFILLQEEPLPFNGTNWYPLNNRYKSFDQLNQTMISVFMARADTMKFGSVRYRLVRRRDQKNECRIEKVMSRLEREVKILFPKDNSFTVEQMVVVNWDELVAFNGSKDKRNTFEAAMLTDGINSFLVLNYVNIQWDRAPQRSGQSPDPYAQTGVNDGRAVYSLPLSGRPSAHKLDRSTNVATPGMWIMKTGKLRYEGEFKSPDVKFNRERLRAVRKDLGFGNNSVDPCQPLTTVRPTPITTTFKAALALRPQSCADLRCQKGICRNHEGGSCCECKPGYIGDGNRNCYKINEVNRFESEGPIRMFINGKKHVGVLYYQGRTYPTAPRAYGRVETSSQIMLKLIRLMFPLFATTFWFASSPRNDAPNAVQLNLMQMTRRTNLEISGVGKFLIEQRVNGLRDIRAKWDTNITGNFEDEGFLPGTRDKMRSNMKHLTFTEDRPGMLQTSATAAVDIKSGRRFTMTWADEIRYIPLCPFKKTPKAFTVYYEQFQGQPLRYDTDGGFYYVTQATVRPGRPDTNPCSYAEVKCPGRHEICVVISATSHECRCRAGYEINLSRQCSDINECLTGRHRCDVNALCVNIRGTYLCNCKPGFRGNGQTCERVNAICDRCSPQAECPQIRQDEYACQCKQGYEGDGYTCRPKRPNKVCTQRCHYYANCINGQCRCKPGMIGDGITKCSDCSSPEGVRCHRNGACYRDKVNNYYICRCLKGFTGDGVESCVANDFTCSKCDQNADCVRGEFCQCRSGYRDVSGRGLKCVKECKETCHTFANCEEDGQCRCKTDFKGDGVRECRFDCALCDRNAKCSATGCHCRQHYEGDGKVCSISHECTADTQCGANGVCYKAPLPRPNPDFRLQCKCREGFRRENGGCVQEEVLLRVLPPRPIKVKEGDRVSLKCEIVKGKVLTSNLVWNKKESFILRRGIRILIDRNRRTKELIIMDARPEDSGSYFCTSDGGGMAKKYVEVVENLCNRKCHRSAFCDSKKHQCTCHGGFRGDGINSCILEVCSNFPKMCDRNAVCKNDICVCNQGYKKMLDKCIEVPDCRKLKDCDKNADCVNRDGMYQCRCRNGFKGNGKTCKEKKLGCNLLNKCVDNAECDYVKIFNKYMCRCKAGYFGSGELKCEKRYDCDKNPRPCGPNSRCQKVRRYDDRSRETQTVGICECQDGHTMIEKTCYKNENLNTSIFMSQGSIIYRIPVVQTAKRRTSIWYSNTVNGYSSIVIALATDCNEKRVYWTSRNRGPSIYSAKANTINSKRIVARNAGQIEGLAVDWIAGNVFYTNPSPKRATVGVVTRDGAHTKIIAWRKVVRPRGIAVDPENGTVYWTDWDRKNPRIESANMDGKERKTVIENLPYLPNGLVFDFKARRLCWLAADKNTGKENSTSIVCIRPDMKSALTPIFQQKAGRPFALTYNSPTFYYTDWQRNRLQYVTGKIRNELKTSTRISSSKLFGVSILPPKCPAGTNGCSRTDNKYGGCRYICLPVPFGGRVCSCPDNLKGCNPTV